jgi:hypothetical protein
LILACGEYAMKKSSVFNGTGGWRKGEMMLKMTQEVDSQKHKWQTQMWAEYEERWISSVIWKCWESLWESVWAESLELWPDQVDSPPWQCPYARCIKVSWVPGWTPLWSSGHSSWLQIRRPGFDSRHYPQKK